MAIENKNLFITKEEFKDSSFYDEDLFGYKNSPNEATNDKTIDLAIDMASNNIDYLSGFSITEKWPENTETDWTQNIKLATAHYVRYALTKGVDYIRGQQSLSISGISESINNPEDPYFIPPDVFNYLRKCKEYKSFKGYELQGVVPNRNNSFFSKFGSNINEDSPWNRYLKIVNLQSNDHRTKIIKNNNPNIIGTIVTIDTNNIKSIDNLTTEELFQQYFSDETLYLVDGKKGQKEKVISVIDKTSDILWEVNLENPNFVNTKDNRGISANNQRIIDVGTPTFFTDATPKIYVDEKSENNKKYVDDNLVFKWTADGQGGYIGTKTLSMNNQQIGLVADPTGMLDASNKRYVDDNLVFLFKNKGQGVYQGTIYLDMSNLQIKNLADPTGIHDATNKQYVDNKLTQFTDEEVRVLKLMLDKVVLEKNTLGDDYFNGFKTQMVVYNEFDNEKKHANFHYGQSILYDPQSGEPIIWIQDGKVKYKNSEIVTMDYIYKKYNEVIVNAKEYIFNEFDDKYSWLFNVEYLGANNKPYSGTLERMAGLTLEIIDCNVGNDFGASSSATIVFNGTNKKLEVKRWEQINLNITKVTIYRKLGI